jgi:hypothetical protein
MVRRRGPLAVPGRLPGPMPGVGWSRQLDHTTLSVTSIYLRGIDNAETIATVHARSAPMIPATTGLGL